MSNIEQGKLNEDGEIREEGEKVFLNNKTILSKNKEADNMIKEYKDKNKMRRNFYQKKPLNN